jgi:hypothetical protein
MIRADHCKFYNCDSDLGSLVKVIPLVSKRVEVCGAGKVAHACNPSYSEGVDLEDRVSRPALKKLPDYLNKKARCGGTYL